MRARTSVKTSVCAFASAVVVISIHAVLHPDGDIGATKKNGYGCNCHGVLPSDSVHVWVTGPDSVKAGTRSLYTLFLHGGPAVAGGFDVAVLRGVLSAADTTAQAEYYDSSFEMTHRYPKRFINDTLRWSFYYRAPAVPGVDTLYSVANSVNLDSLPTGDQWNFGANFPVTVLPESSLSVDAEPAPWTYHLSQNYPNPFNPATTISFDLERESNVGLRVFDVSGRVIATLVEGRESAGRHSVRWNSEGEASGIYFYRLSVGDAGDRRRHSETKKMALIR